MRHRVLEEGAVGWGWCSGYGLSRDSIRPAECPVCLPGVTGCGDGAQDTGARAGGPEVLGGWSPLKAPEHDGVVGGLKEGALQCGCSISGADAPWETGSASLPRC